MKYGEIKWEIQRVQADLHSTLRVSTNVFSVATQKIDYQRKEMWEEE